MEAFDEGVLAEIYVQDGNKVQVGQKLALLVAKGEKFDSGGPKPVQESKPSPEKAEDKAAPPKEPPATTQGQQDSQSELIEAVAVGRIKASPLFR
jgi:pyruvate/2-oxoglutarate dehydrogenase complex dihydrolipoamide acyltransferase (E2) component